MHKERSLSTIEHDYPAAHYVVVDDKPHVLARIKARWNDRVTTVFVRQGHYASDRKYRRFIARADRRIDTIAEMLTLQVGDGAVPERSGRPR